MLALRFAGCAVPKSGRRKETVTQETRILLVEDDPLFMKLVTSMLLTRNYQVAGVGSAEEALDSLKQASFDLLLTDLKMEGIGGVGLLRSLLSDQPFPRNRIIVITGEPQTSEDSLWVESLGIPILRKPFMLKGLFDSIDAVLRS